MAICAIEIREFFKRVNKTDSCWFWKNVPTTKGYGLFKFKGKQCLAHRWAYKWCFGSIPKGMNICHSCDIRNCVNPNHLWAGTYVDNMQDALLKGRMKSGFDIWRLKNPGKMLPKRNKTRV